MSLFDSLRKRRERKKIQAAKKKEIEKIVKKVIQASVEGTHEDITSTSVTGRTVTDNTLKKNAYPTYKSTTQTMYDMYNGVTDFGGEFLGSIVETRIAFIAGGGATIIAEKESTAKWINSFLSDNRLVEGSKLFDNVKI
jgi:hypothetical protein